MRTVLAVSAVLLVHEAAFAADPKARKKLDDSYVKFTPAEFVSRVASGDRKTVDLFIQAGIDVNAPGARGRTALLEAASRDDAKLLAALLAAGADASRADPEGTTPLCAAAEAGKDANVATLLRAKASTSAACGISHRTPLQEALRHGSLSSVQALLAAGAAVDARDAGGQTALHYAADEDPQALVQALIAAHADVAARSNGGETPLHRANNHRSVANVQALLAAGAPVDARNGRGETALFEAARNDSPELIAVLLAAGADPAARDAGRTTPMEIARKVGALKAQAALKDAKRVVVSAPPSVATTAGGVSGADAAHAELTRMGLAVNADTLFQRVEAGDARAIALLLRAGVAPASRNNQGRTALYEAASGGKAEVAKALLDNGANPEDSGAPTRNLGGTDIDASGSPLMEAVQRGDTEMVRVLLAGKARLNARDSSGSTPLTQAAALDTPDMARLLIQAGADVNAVDKEGYPVITGAVAMGNVEMVKVLLQAG
ncbi:MAG TPA: ankyrin repeat domain-containing protein, partial [Vicinamibacteria bacterium]|nr:ankyrin repeat domain-containing protein [Vicinamibacteria bacterium]